MRCSFAVSKPWTWKLGQSSSYLGCAAVASAGRRSQSDGLRLSVQLGPSQRSVNEARRRSSSRSPRQEAPVSTEQASSAEAPADAAEDAAESGSSSSNDTAAAEGDVSTTGIDIQVSCAKCRCVLEALIHHQLYINSSCQPSQLSQAADLLLACCRHTAPGWKKQHHLQYSFFSSF